VPKPPTPPTPKAPPPPTPKAPTPAPPKATETVAPRPETAVAAHTGSGSEAQKPTTTPSASSPASASAGKAKHEVGAVLPVQPPSIKLPPGAINVPGPAQVVPVRRPPKQDESSLEPEEKRPTPPVNRLPPVGGASDDPFASAAQEGRVRIGRTKKKEEPPKG
jgi:hypothetical protein